MVCNNEWQDPRFPRKTMSRTSCRHLPFQQCTVNAPGLVHDVKENMIHQTRPPSSIAPWSSSDAHVPDVHGVSTGTLTCLQIQSHRHSKLCVLTPIYQNQHYFCQQFCYRSSSAQSKKRVRLCSPHISEPWVPFVLSLVHQLSFFRPLLVNHCIMGILTRPAV